MSNDKSDLRWGVEQRLEFIGFRLFWEGHVNCSDPLDQFVVSVNQAPIDLNRYIGFAPEKMVYDNSAQTYVADGILDKEDSWNVLLNREALDAIAP